MEENAKGIMYVDVLLVLKVIIVKLVDDLHNVQRAQEHAEMGLVNRFCSRSNRKRQNNVKERLLLPVSDIQV